ncbi:MAG: tRNA (adenosine(37)-N6)-threonylcarbamoyltransferase complex transferase subunit TsaD [Verrucomicrobiales bacterium]|nr:tRNA (adenosine(37)-N6)-threonylcarbamoyltransferase complex transferase subunit TsaD [Verrucomicrobiales bacterium]
MECDLVLAIETSCDETAVALAKISTGEIVTSLVASQVELHAPYGGVVPELASRNHSADLRPLVQSAIDDAGVGWGAVAAVAATSGPGLASSLLVGDTTAKALALTLGRPFYSINHMEGHLLSPFIGTGSEIQPHIALVVSGGHTMVVHLKSVANYSVLGSTKDDAAGEAFDKVGKMLGLPYPGGPEIGRRAQSGNRKAFEFPRSMLDSGDYQFSFSGLKTSALYTLQKLETPLPESVLNDFCAAFEEAIVDVLVEKLFSACAEYELEIASISGGVSCNRRLREQSEERAREDGVNLYLASPEYSTDNAGMIAFAAVQRIQADTAPSPLTSDIDPNLKLV